MFVAAGVFGALAWLLLAAVRNHVPSVSEIRDRELSYDELVRQLGRVKRIEKPDAYAAALYRRAYGRNP